ncbi:Tautomerase enzyme family protein [Acinetobacter baumannii]|nr:Tautomerase enzyme family protein [Acinetobacter baumannii]SST91691.1 Tautomerase enzyme family protein [Acinetobacter baumannii]
MFAGRSPATKKQLIQTLFRNIEEQCKIAPHDIEITIFETPKKIGASVVKMQMNCF